MSSENPTFKDIFKTENDIPEEYKVPIIHQREYLLNGELVEWSGDVTEIYSPICIPTENGLERMECRDHDAASRCRSRPATRATGRATNPEPNRRHWNQNNAV